MGRGEQGLGEVEGADVAGGQEQAEDMGLEGGDPEGERCGEVEGGADKAHPCVGEFVARERKDVPHGLDGQ